MVNDYLYYLSQPHGSSIHYYNAPVFKCIRLDSTAPFTIKLKMYLMK